MADTQEEEATQPATQVYDDDRRHDQGNSGGISDEDAADIICQLTPSSLPALEAADQIYRETPHLTQREGGVAMRQRGEHVDDQLRRLNLVSCALTLRFSYGPKSPLLGYQFGRNPGRCDFPLGALDPARRVSNQHFRIYINEFGSVMIEDQSTNGTVYDGKVLKGRDKENGRLHKHVLESGRKITLVINGGEDFTFMTSIPTRTDEAQVAYNENLTRHVADLAVLTAQEAELAKAKAKKGGPVDLFPRASAATTSGLLTVQPREWKGGKTYSKGPIIGKGAFAVVYMATARLDGKPFAAKQLEKRRFMKQGILDQKIDTEMKIMSRITHANVVQYVEHIDWVDHLYIIMEYIPNGDLGSHVNRNGALPEPEVKGIAIQLLDALAYLHAHGITHRDIKPDNILLASLSPYVPKLTDFGLSKLIDKKETFMQTFCGTLLYCAPEVFAEYCEFDENGVRTLRGAGRRETIGDRYTNSCDVWSLAGVFWFALCQSNPYPVTGNVVHYIDLLTTIMGGVLDIRPLQEVNVSESCLRAIKSMLRIRSNDRATVAELQQSSWITGVDDEVEMTQESVVDPELEEEATQLSQLSIHPREVADSEEFDFDDNMTEETDILAPPPREIPSSYDEESNGDLGGDESYGFEYENLITTGNNGRLFGEVNMSDVGSSGAIPSDQLNLPIDEAHHNINASYPPQDDDSNFEPASFADNFDTSRQAIDPALPDTMPSPSRLPDVQVNQDSASNSLEQGLRADRSSSLFGAETHLGNLNMHSPVSAAYPMPDTPTAEVTNGVSLRRPREEDDDDPDSDWVPADMKRPSKKLKSKREIVIDVPASIFWDPKDPSTHHDNYPRMTTSEYHQWGKYAMSKGEAFLPGQTVFERTMESFRQSRSRSSSLEPARAHSEPTTADEGRRMMLRRDERVLGSAGVVPTSNDEGLPETANASNAATGQMPTPVDSPIRPVVGNDFQRPKAILAKLSATDDSGLSIHINIIDAFTSWGRGTSNTLKYSNQKDVRVPRHAFKMILFKPRFYTQDTKDVQFWKDENQDMAFYVSTKSTKGIWVNGIRLKSYDCQNYKSASRYWIELRHGDTITVSEAEDNITKFKFECFFGKSKQTRGSAEKVEPISNDLTFLADIEDATLRQENAIFAQREIQEKKEQEFKATEKEEQRRKEVERQQVKDKEVERPTEQNGGIYGVDMSFSRLFDDY